MAWLSYFKSIIHCYQRYGKIVELLNNSQSLNTIKLFGSNETTQAGVGVKDSNIQIHKVCMPLDALRYK